MADITAAYLGLTLKNPVIAASSRLTSQLNMLRKCEDAGVGAVVLKSIFEEQIEHDSRVMIDGMDAYTDHADGYDFLANSSKEYAVDRYLELVEKAKAALSIPVIASINCVRPGSWLEYADRFQEVGADALELNMYILPSNTKVSGRETEQNYLDLIRMLKQKLSIPLAVKLGFHFSGLGHFLKQADDLGIAGLVLFNRYYRPDIDIENLVSKAGSIVSSASESSLSLQWTALLSGELDCDICANTGIYSGETVIKQLLAGAAAVQICSAIMSTGFGVVRTMTDELAAWMDRKGFDSIRKFRGLLNRTNSDQPEVWDRSQYIKAVCGIS